jgi:hypothetical protein
MFITKAWHDIHGRKYIELDGLQVKVPFRYNRVTGVDVQGHIPIQDMPAGTQVKAEVRTVKWDGLEYYVLKSICPHPQVSPQTDLRCPTDPLSPATESVSRATKI